MAALTRRTSFAVLLACCALLAVAGTASAEDETLYKYEEGFAGGRSLSFSQADLPPSVHLVTGNDWALEFNLEGLSSEDPPEAYSELIPTSELLLGSLAVPDKVSFHSFTLHIDYPSPYFGTMVLYFGDDYGESVQESRNALTGVSTFTVKKIPDGKGGWRYPGASGLRYMLQLNLPNGTYTGTIMVHDITVEYGEYVEAADDDGGGGGGDGDDDKDAGGDGDKPTGVAYMGGSDGGSGEDSGGSGTGPGQGGRGNSAGTSVPAGTGSVDTDAPVVTSPRSTAGDPVTGYPLRLEDVVGGGEGGAGEGTGDGAAAGPTTSSGGAPGLSPSDLAWLAVALAVMAPFAAAEIDRRRMRRRLHKLVDTTPDGPAPRATVPA